MQKPSILLGGTLGVAMALALFTTLLPPHHSSALYTGGRIIDDTILLNASSMNPDNIQAFLSGKGSGLASFVATFDCASTGTQSAQAYQTSGAPCGQSASAAQIIYYASQVYGINPKVVLATLQKEQSLVTTPNPSSWQINQAMGYGCPDSGGCGASNFLYQLDNGTWLLRYHFERARGNMDYWFHSTSWVCGVPKNYYRPSLYPGQNVSFYDDAGTLYTTLWLTNAASSTMYCYTPHAYNNPQGLYGLPIAGTTGQYYSGSYNFVTYYERWFGSTVGSLWRTVDNGTLYYVDGKQKFIVTSMSLSSQYGFDAQDIRYVSQAELDAIPLAASPLSSVLGQLVKSPSDSDSDGATVYLIDSARRIPISSMSILAAYGYTGSDISNLPLDDILRLPASSGVLSSFAQDPSYTMYQIENGKKRIFFELSKYNAVNSSGAMSSLSSFTLSRIGFGQPQIDGSYLIIGPDGTVRLYNAGNYSTLTSMGVYNCWGFSGLRLYRIPSYDFVNGISRGNLNCLAKDSGSTMYLMNGTTKYLIAGSGLTPSITEDDVITRISTTPVPNAIQSPHGEISIIENGSRRALPSMLTFSGLGLTGADVAAVSQDVYVSLPAGPIKFAAGNVVLDASGTVSVISNSNTRYAFTSAQLFNDYGFSWSKLIASNVTTLSAYPSSGNLNKFVTVGGIVYLIDNGVKYMVDASLYSAYGLTPAGLQTLDSQLVSGATTKQATRFMISASGGTIYYMDAGQKHPISSWQKFIELGGLTSLMTVNPSTLQLFSNGSSI